MAIRLQPALIRAARGLLNWSIVALAQAAELSVSTIKRMEMADPQFISFNAYAQVRRAFEKVGVRFLDDDGKGIGLRFQPR